MPTSAKSTQTLPSKQFLLCHPVVLDRVIIYSCHHYPSPAICLALSTLALLSCLCLLSASASGSCLPLICPTSRLLHCLLLCCLRLLLPLQSLVQSMHGSCLRLSLMPPPLVLSVSHCQQAPHVPSTSCCQQVPPLVAFTSYHLPIVSRLL